jgi:protease-4
MKAYPHLVRKLFCEPLLVLPSTYATFERELLSRMGVPFDASHHDPHARLRLDHNPGEGEDGNNQPRAETPAEASQRRINNVMTIYGSVAVISVDGVIDKHLSDWDMACYGGVDLDDIDAAVSQVYNMDRVKDVAFYFNTPGGSATGVPETAARIHALGALKKDGGGGKRTHARVDMLCASAGQWLASQCNKTSAAPSATMGSIGVYCALLDQTGWMAKEGLKVNLIKAGAYKAMGASFKELTDEERSMMQSRVDELWSDFKTSVRSGRGDVAESTMQGQTFAAKDAKKLGLVDEISPASMDEYISDLMEKR